MRETPAHPDLVRTPTGNTWPTANFCRFSPAGVKERGLRLSAPAMRNRGVKARVLGMWRPARSDRRPRNHKEIDPIAEDVQSIATAKLVAIGYQTHVWASTRAQVCRAVER